jgi:D-glycero-D-manno-heptose 1,7-bisphosphate phosphatase
MHRSQEIRPMRPAVFIDKDGTLIRNVPYNVDPTLLQFMPAAPQALCALAAAGFALVVVTNQSGLALRKFSRGEFDTLATALRQRLRAEAGVELTDLLHCPHAPGADGLPVCPCRKPAAGLLLKAARRHHLDLQRSWMVGDTLDDIEAGRRCGCRTVLFDSGGETVWRRAPLRTPHRQMTDWVDVAQLIGGDRQGIEEVAAC